MLLTSVVAVTAALVSCPFATAQTYSSCNPLYSTGCPTDPALGKAISVDFTKGAVNSFTAEGSPTYDSSGVHFTVSKSGDAPTLTSVFYIMFGKVSFSMKCAPGAGIVSTLVLESDDLDEIDLEWLGADNAQVQTNYFGKGNVTTYNRGAYNPAPNNQGQFVTYTLEWTESQIVWSVGGTVVRVLTPATADTNQYPQTPMRVKFGAWSAGDSANAAGTIAWARGPTDYSKGPYTMTVQNIAITDYSTGTQYKYGDTSGSWGSIQAIGGKVNGNAGGAASTIVTAAVASVTSASPTIPAGWPWVASTTLSTATRAASSAAGIPSGWVITASGKIVPASSAAAFPASTPSSSAVPSPLPSSQVSGAGIEISTGWDDRGFPTTKTLQPGWQTVSRSYDQQGSLVTSPASATLSAASRASEAPCLIANCGTNGKVVASSTSSAQAVVETSTWRKVALIAAVAASRLLL